MKKTSLKLTLILGILLLAFGFINYSSAQTTKLPKTAERAGETIINNLPSPGSPSLSTGACPVPEREPRFFYREKVVHEERQFRAKHPGCGGDIMMRKWQVVGLEIGKCNDGQANPNSCDIEWLDEFVYYYDRFTPKKKGEVFDKVGSWQKAWPSESQWLTEEELNEKYGEPIPFPTCQSDCLQSPPGIPDGFEVGQEDPYYFQNPWLPEILTSSGTVSSEEEYISTLREKNLLGGTNPLKELRLPVKLFWWNIPGWKNGWIENGEYKTCEGPEDIACVDSYIIKFDNINREDRPATFYRYSVINKLVSNEYKYNDASKIYEKLTNKNHEAYVAYRREKGDDQNIDTIRYDRDNIIGCDNCGTEQKIWLNSNTFNSLSFNPKYDYERPQREWIKNYLLNEFKNDDKIIKDIIRETYSSYGRPVFFRSGTEHTYTLQATCAHHDYLEEKEGARGPETTFSFTTSDAPELISPLDPNWTSPYNPKDYNPNFDSTRLKAKKINCKQNKDGNVIEGSCDYYPTKEYKDGYPYPAEEGKYVKETKTISEYPDNPLWSQSVSNLILQDHVKFREKLKWAQQWYQDNPQDMPRPPKTYLLSFGESTRLMESNNQILEDCHNKLKSKFKDNPVCTYKIRSKKTYETQLSYPLPDHLDKEMDLFTLPENRKRDVYSWNIATCRDSGASKCTDFSQMWRFQLNEKEEKEIYAPENDFPSNGKIVGFPFTLNWKRRFGARSYVYRIRKKVKDDPTPSNWQDNDVWKDIKIQKGRDIYYDLGELVYNPNPNYKNGLLSFYNWNGDLGFNTTYEWDIKACWTKSPDFDSSSDNYYQRVTSWAEEEGEERNCSKWRSEEFDDAPFTFTTMGAAPKDSLPPKEEFGQSSNEVKEVKYPITFKWGIINSWAEEDFNPMPGTKSYAIVIKNESKEESNNNSNFSNNNNFENLDNFNLNNNPQQNEIILPSNADMGAITPNLSFSYWGELDLGVKYSYQIYSCAKPIKDKAIYLDFGAYGETLPMDITQMAQKMEEQGCALEYPSEIKRFIPILPAPNLYLGTTSKEKPEQLSIDESMQFLKWDSVPGAKAYKVIIKLISPQNNNQSLIETVYAQSNEQKELNKVVTKNSISYDFPQQGLYSWTVQPCLTKDCKDPGGNHSTVRGKISNPYYIEFISPTFSNFKGIVPCGRNINIFDSNPKLDSRDNCKIGHLFVMIGLIIEEILVKLFIPYSLVMLLLYTGYLYYTGLGDPKTMQKVFKVWEYAFKGYLLIFLAWIIVGTFLTLIGYQFGVWWQITNLNL